MQIVSCNRLASACFNSPQLVMGYIIKKNCMIDTSSNHDNINPITIFNLDITYEEVKSLLITFFDRLIDFLVIFQM